MSAVGEAKVLLGSIPALAGASAATVEALAAAATLVEVPAGATVFRAGDPADSVAVVRHGRLHVLAADGIDVASVLGVGSVLGELGVLAGSSRSATVRAVRDTGLVVVPSAAFHTVLDADPAAMLAMARSLAARLQRSRDIAPPPPLAGVVALVAAAPEPAWEGLAGGVIDALQALGPTQVLGPSSPATTSDVQADALPRAESAGELVVLTVPDPGADPIWTEYCLRSADRVVVLTRGVVPSGVASRPGVGGCDVAVVGPVGSDRLGRVLDGVGARRVHRLGDPPTAAEAARLARRVTGRGVGLVLSGGGARGLAHVGALAALEEVGLAPDLVGGTSMGALVGALVARGHDAARIDAALRRELVDRHPFNDFTVPRRALIKGQKAVAMLDRLLGPGTIEELPVPYFAVSADLGTGDRVVHRRGRLRDAVAASMAVPGLVPPVGIDGRQLVDGGVIDNLPVDVMADEAEGMVIAVDVMRHPDHPRRRSGRSAAGDPAPTIVETLVRAGLLGSWERAEHSRARADVLVVPEVADLGLLDFDRMDEAVEAGRRAARASLAASGLVP